MVADVFLATLFMSFIGRINDLPSHVCLTVDDIRETTKGVRCWKCSKKQKEGELFSRCSKCFAEGDKIVPYCSKYVQFSCERLNRISNLGYCRECQKADWKRHKGGCGASGFE